MSTADAVPAGRTMGLWTLAHSATAFELPGDLIDFTPELRAEAVERAKKYRWASTPFNPPMLGNVNGMLGAITVGTATNWPGGGYDPELHMAFAPAGNMAGTRTILTA